jgi:hypothetical protein
MPEAAEVSAHSLTPRQRPLGGVEPHEEVPGS